MNPLLSLFVTAMLCLAAEVTLRWTGSTPPEYVTLEKFKDAYRVSRPNSTAVWTGRLGQVLEFENTVRTNASGLHDSAHTREKPAGVYRILVLGDSYVEAHQVPLEDAFHQLLEEALNHELPDRGFEKSIEVIAMGRSGDGSFNELIGLATEGLAFSPDLVVTLLTDQNDFDDDWHFERRAKKIESHDWRTAFPDPGVLRSLHMYRRLMPLPESWLNRWIAFKLVEIYRRREIFEKNADWWRERAGIYAVPGTDYHEAEREKWEHAFRLTADNYFKMSRLCRSHGVDFLAVFTDRLLSYHEGRRKNLFRTVPELRGVLDFDRPIAMLKLVFNRYDIRHLDLNPAFAGHYQSKGRRSFFEYDGHWNREGHRIAAGALTDYLLKDYFP